MHAAPPLRVSVGGSPLWTGAVAALSAAATTNLLAWLMAIAERPPSMALIVAVAAIAAAVVAHAVWRRQGRGELCWTGDAWQWRDLTGQSCVALDLDRWILLRFDAHGGGRCWIALEQRRVQGPWAGLRAALYAPRRPDDRDAAAPA